MLHDGDSLINEAVLYVCAFVVSASGVWAVTMTLQDPEISRAFMWTLTAGFAASWFARRYGRLRPYALVWTVVFGAAALLWYHDTGTFLGQPLAQVIGADRQLELAALLAGLTIVRSFGLVRVEDLLFCVVPSLAIFGLMGSKTFDPQFTAAFIVFAFAAAYLGGHSHLMAERDRSRMPPGKDARRVARERFALLAGLFAVAVAAAIPVSRAAAALLPAYEPAVSGGGARGGGGREPAGVGGRPVWTSARSLPVGLGPIRLSRAVIMRVTCEEPLYWRAGSLVEYTGDEWRAAREGLAATVTRGENGAFDLRPVVKGQPGRTVSQRFELVGASGAILFAAMQPVEARLPGHVGPVLMDPAGAIFAQRGRISQGESYEVVSQVDNLRPAGAPSALGADDPALLVIPHSAREVAGFAKEAVGTATSAEAQVAAIVGWVRSRATYSLDAPATPAGEDAVIYFLTKSRIGYCDLFASAVALMCRAVGIPARVAIGFSPGEYDAGVGAYVVRESDSHSWVEVYLPQVAKSRMAGPSGTATAANGSAAGWTTVEASPAGAEAARASARRDWLRRVMRFVSGNLLYAAALLGALAWASLEVKARWLDERLALRRRERALLAQGARGAVIVVYDKLGRALARRGRARRAWETPNEYAQRLGRDAYLATIMPGVTAITRQYLAARFSEREISGEQADAAREALEEAQGRLRKIRGVR
jgi:transglutaminase-like putative cysteine protease